MLKLVLSLVLAGALTQTVGAQTNDATSPDGEEAKQRAAERLQFMKKSVNVYELQAVAQTNARWCHLSPANPTPPPTWR